MQGNHASGADKPDHLLHQPLRLRNVDENQPRGREIERMLRLEGHSQSRSRASLPQQRRDQTASSNRRQALDLAVPDAKIATSLSALSIALVFAGVIHSLATGVQSQERILWTIALT